MAPPVCSWLPASFRKKRETRAPLVAELLPYQAVLPEKYHYLLDAPRQDDDGNPAIIRYSRKTKEQYVMTEKRRQSHWLVSLV